MTGDLVNEYVEELQIMKRSHPHISVVLILLLFSAGCGHTVQYYINPGGHRVRTGLENFINCKAKKYKGRKAVLVTNHSGYDFDLHQNIQLLKDKGIVIASVLAPEHGIYGYKNDLDYQLTWYDASINLQVYNLYRCNQYQLRYLFQAADMVIFDIQDMGMRCYTYITNLKDIIDALDGLDRELIVLDRPNPAGFIGIDGAFLDKRFTTRYVSAFPAPFLYDMTIGEAARYYRGEFKPKVKLNVIAMSRYDRRMFFPEQGSRGSRRRQTFPPSSRLLYTP